MQHIDENSSRDMEACGWDDDFWEEIGLRELVDGHHSKIGICLHLKWRSNLAIYRWYFRILFYFCKSQLCFNRAIFVLLS